MKSPLSQQSATRSGRQQDGQPRVPSPSPSHFPRKTTRSSARTAERSDSSVTQAKSCWKIILNRLKLQTEKIILEEQAGFRGGRSHKADQPTNPLREISPAPARPLPCPNRLQEGLRQGLASSFVGNHEEVKHQRQPYPSHQKPL